MIPLEENLYSPPTHISKSTGTHPNEVFGGAYNFCKAKFSDSVLIDKCATQLTQANTLKSTHANIDEMTDDSTYPIPMYLCSAGRTGHLQGRQGQPGHLPHAEHIP
jgi:hypothetical protein